jgi:hypothetical protein
MIYKTRSERIESRSWATVAYLSFVDAETDAAILAI